jgi:flagellar motor switch protein FliG|tara:strand:- start:423 stop:1100 length:678 start_codon:yes stop_codon:yes gene_type:complete
MFDSAMDDEIYVTISLETPQTIALILTHMIPDRAPNILIQFPKEKRNTIAQRIATMEGVNQNTVNILLSKIQISLQGCLNKVISSRRPQKSIEGSSALAKMLAHTGDDATEDILKSLENTDQVSKIREAMFTFEDIMLIDDTNIQKYILKLPSVQDNLATAIKGLGEEVKDKFLRNMPDRIKNRVEKERQSLGKVRASVVREARKLILDEIRVLIESGQVQVEKS